MASLRLTQGLAFMLVLAGGGCDSGTGPSLPCADPVPLERRADPASPVYIVMFREGVDGAGETARLAEIYDFAPRHVYTSGTTGFSAELLDAALTGIRCEQSVRSISPNDIIQTTLRWGRTLWSRSAA